MNTSNPFDLLLELESRSIASSAEIPIFDQVADDWVGIGFLTEIRVSSISDLQSTKIGLTELTGMR